MDTKFLMKELDKLSNLRKGLGGNIHNWCAQVEFILGYIIEKPKSCAIEGDELDKVVDEKENKSKCIRGNMCGICHTLVVDGICGCNVHNV